MIATSILSLFLLGVCGLLIDSHRRGRARLLAEDPSDDRVRRFANSQYRRRMMSSVVIGLIGVGLALRPLVELRPLPMTIYVLLLVLAVGWTLMLALIDTLASAAYYRRLHRRHVAADVKLARELQAAREKAE